MENLKLTTEEKKELEKRGFFVKKTYTTKDFIKTILYILIYLIIGWYLFILISAINNLIPGIFSGQIFLILIMGIIIYLLPIVIFLIGYIRSGSTLYGKNGIIEFGKISNSRKIYYINTLLVFKKILNNGKNNLTLNIIKLGSIGVLIFIFVKNRNLGLSIQTILINFNILLFNLVCGIYLFLEVIRKIYQSFNPLYAFGNLGEKIQKLTPRIEEQSKQMQSEFQSDMNFSILSDGFDSLSATFSEIVSLVIKLEKAEIGANKGNLFDSEKYINSLRLDIITPLRSLREFLEDQKNKLLESQKELIQVRVGGSEESGNTELASKRSESLIMELTENIEKLDVMIGKMG